LAWESVTLKVPGSKKTSKLNKLCWTCPKCERKFFTIPYKTKAPIGVSLKKFTEDEKEFLVLICDRCGQFMAFEGCVGECASLLKSKCEICGKYYCHLCGIVDDIDIDERHVELRYCNDHIPEWYKNR
jgi:hypothetical protein